MLLRRLLRRDWIERNCCETALLWKQQGSPDSTIQVSKQVKISSDCQGCVEVGRLTLMMENQSNAGTDYLIDEHTNRKG